MTKLSLWKVFSRMSNRWACNWWSVAGRRACKRAWGLNKKTSALRCVAFVDCSPAAKEPRSWKEANIHLMSDITYRDAYLLEMQTTTSPPSHVSSTCPYIRPIVFQFKFVLHSRITFCLNGKLRNARKKKNCNGTRSDCPNCNRNIIGMIAQPPIHAKSTKSKYQKNISPPYNPHSPSLTLNIWMLQH